MDIGYRPPSQRPDECHALEQNYMNCIYQKAVNDNVFSNKCIMDNILWFHLECPKYVDFWDNPNYFKLKMRNYINEKILNELKVQPSSHKILNQNTYNKTLYPEDQALNSHLKEFTDKFEKEHHPAHNPEEYKVSKKPGFNSEKVMTPNEAFSDYLLKGFKPEELKPEYWIQKQ